MKQKRPCPGRPRPRNREHRSRRGEAAARTCDHQWDHGVCRKCGLSRTDVQKIKRDRK
ncbi:MAG: hypothetical protein KH027_07230 [Clostridiales bacterium]|nr:hypothetical protein [Clostridiales bacterium]